MFGMMLGKRRVVSWHLQSKNKRDTHHEASRRCGQSVGCDGDAVLGMWGFQMMQEKT
jgi:hypothetical protein